MKGRTGFTLIEIMLVVAIIGIIAAIATPIAKKHRENSLERDYATDFTDLVSSLRAYYLIHNEWPADSANCTLPISAKPYIPSRFIGTITSTISTTHRRAFNKSPTLAADSYAWDYENWLNINLGIRMAVIGISDAELNSRALELAKTFFQANDVERIYINADRITYIFRESPSSGENRYY